MTCSTDLIMDEFNDTTTIKEELEDCCQRTESEKSLIAMNSFWIEGIGLILVSKTRVVGQDRCN